MLCRTAGERGKKSHQPQNDSVGKTVAIASCGFFFFMILPPLSLYVHIPWCVRKCPYCDFNSHAHAGALPVDDYIGALAADLDRDLAQFGDALGGRPLVSLFLGGGTPSLFAPDAIARIIDLAGKRFTFRDGIEITLET